MFSRSRLKKPRRSPSPSGAGGGASAPVSKSSCQVRATSPRRIGTPAPSRGRPVEDSLDGVRLVRRLFDRRVRLRILDDRVVAVPVRRRAHRLAAAAVVRGAAALTAARSLDLLAAVVVALAGLLEHRVVARLIAARLVAVGLVVGCRDL